jgi:hypothetical protein
LSILYIADLVTVIFNAAVDVVAAVDVDVITYFAVAGVVFDVGDDVLIAYNVYISDVSVDFVIEFLIFIQIHKYNV